MVVVTLLVRSIVGEDHCPTHDHHAHLCLAHGDAWASRPWAVALVASAVAIVLARLSLFAAALLRGRRAVALLRSASTRIDDVRLVDSDRPFCFVSGLRTPEIYASSAAWHGLDEDERAAMFAHERGHVRHRDLAWRAGLEVVSALGAPLTPSPLLARWEHATERLRDGEAAEAVGGPEAVAQAMVRMCRLGAPMVPARTTSFTPAPAALGDRVEALLGASPRGERAAAALGALGLVLVVGMVAIVATHAEPLHHLLESLLG
jgi:Zn-dependent protease with chaperone function